MHIRKAERKKAKLRLALAGASGSGKTWGALEIATGMAKKIGEIDKNGLCGKIGMIDTESGRGELYGCDFEYDIIRLEAPFSPERYVEAIKQFEKNGYDILIIDSLSHAWSGDGGVLSIVEKAGGQFQSGWKLGTPQQNLLIESIITSNLHIITTLRVKTEYVVEKNEKGKNEPRKIGLAPIQRDQIDYEFTVFMTLDQNHNAFFSKDNTRLYQGQFLQPSNQIGECFMEWLNTGINAEEIILRESLQEIDACLDFLQLKEKIANLTHKYSLKLPEEYKLMLEAATKKKDSFK